MDETQEFAQVVEKPQVNTDTWPSWDGRAEWRLVFGF
jgi:hypothetical protein